MLSNLPVTNIKLKAWNLPGFFYAFNIQFIELSMLSDEQLLQHGRIVGLQCILRSIDFLRLGKRLHAEDKTATKLCDLSNSLYQFREFVQGGQLITNKPETQMTIFVER